MKRISFLALFLSAIALLVTSCGTSDSVKSLQLGSLASSAGGFYNLAGQDGTLQLTVTAVYNSGKLVDVTRASTFSVKPQGCAESAAVSSYLCPGGSLPANGPDVVPISPTGLMTGIISLCTWQDTPVSNPPDPPNWLYTGFYQVTATYKGFTSQPIAVGVGVTASNDPKGSCGPT